MGVRELDAATAPLADLLGLHELEQACAVDLQPPGRSADEAVAFFRHVPAAHPRRRWLAQDSRGLIVGAAALSVYGPKFVYVEVLVAPAHRRRGVGTMLLETVRAAARADGAGAVFGHHATPAGAAFAAAAGARDDQRDIRSRLDLAAAQLSEPSVPAGWRLHTWIGGAPDELVASFARARDAMHDAPTPGGLAGPSSTVAEIRSIEHAAAARGREVRVTVALDDCDEIAAFTDLRVTPGARSASTDDTAVVAAARGCGLAVAVKLESLRRLRADRLEVVHVTTMNAESNERMRAINERIGFVPTQVLTTTVLVP